MNLNINPNFAVKNTHKNNRPSFEGFINIGGRTIRSENIRLIMDLTGQYPKKPWDAGNGDCVTLICVRAGANDDSGFKKFLTNFPHKALERICLSTLGKNKRITTKLNGRPPLIEESEIKDEAIFSILARIKNTFKN